jgi:Flp pilus assembly protein CpaB
MTRKSVLGAVLVAGGVAVGWGLVAAFRTAQKNPEPTSPDVQLVGVLVASKELPPGTVFRKDLLKDQVKRKQVRPEDVPENAITSEDDLIEKQLAKLLRADDSIGHGDLKPHKPPIWCGACGGITVRLTADKAAPFLQPGDRIDIIGTGVTRKNQEVGLTILPHVLVCTDGVDATPPDVRAAGKMTVQLTSVRVNTEEAMLLRMAETANLRLSFIPRNEESGERNGERWSMELVKEWLKKHVSDSENLKPITLPARKDLITVRLVVDRTTPFLKAGSRIAIFGTAGTRRHQVVGLMVLPNVLVMAEGVNVKAPNESASGNMNIQIVTLAVSTEEAMLIRMCETANLQLSCVLLSEECGDRSATEKWSPDKVKKWLKENTGVDLSGIQPGANGLTTVKLPVPTEDLPAGTVITYDLIAQKFKNAEFTAPPPNDAVTNINEHVGRFLLEKVAANQFVPKTRISDRPKPKSTDPDRSTVTGPVKRYKYRKLENGEWELVGEIKDDGTVVPIQRNK